MDPQMVALRAVEIQRHYSYNSKLKYAYVSLRNAIDIGHMVRMANMLRGRGIVDYERLLLSCASFDMQPATTNNLLNIFEVLHWVTLVKEEGNISKVEEYVPQLPIVLDTLGKLSITPQKEIGLKPLSSVENLTLEVLDMCVTKPSTLEAIISELEISKEDLNKVISVGNDGRFLEVVKTIDGEDVLWSPIYTYNKYDNLKKFLDRQTIEALESFEGIMDICSNTVGVPLQSFPSDDQTLACAAIESGWLKSIELSMPYGTAIRGFNFLFPPFAKFEDSSPAGDIFEKAKLILSSIRLGEYYAPTWKIKYPDKIIRKLITDGTFNKPYSGAKNQYIVPAHKASVFELVRTKGYSYGKEYWGYKPVVIKNDNNIKALRIVEELLKPSPNPAISILESDIETADSIFKSTKSCLDSYEWLGSNSHEKAMGKADPRLEQQLIELGIAVSGGEYK